VKDLDVASLRLEVVADLDASVACEELDELQRVVLNVSVGKICETLISLMIFLSQ
jgi:hypothetical protein